MINFDGEELKKEFNAAFGNLYFAVEPNGNDIHQYDFSIDKLTLEQLWWLAKFAKHVRGRCRNNSAFNNFMNRNFAPARFSEVPKEYNGRHYMGLKISVGENSSEGDNEE